VLTRHSLFYCAIFGGICWAYTRYGQTVLFFPCLMVSIDAGVGSYVPGVIVHCTAWRLTDTTAGDCKHQVLISRQDTAFEKDDPIN